MVKKGAIRGRTLFINSFNFFSKILIKSGLERPV